MGSMSPKSNQLFSMSQQYRCTSLVKIHPFVVEIGCRQAIFKQSDTSVTLILESRSSKSNQFFSLSQQYSCTSLVKIHSSLSGERVQKSHFSQIWALLWPWKWGHQNLISSFSCFNNIVLQIWSKSIYTFMRKGADKPFFNNLSPFVTLKMGSRSPKFNQFLSMSEQYRCTSLGKIHPFILEIGCRQAIFKHSEPLWPWKLGQGHQNLISYYPFLSNIAVQVRSKSIHSFWR